MGSAAGIRAWLAYRRPLWLTPRRLQIATAGLVGLALVASSVTLG